jgi:hypothetical protein
MKPWDETPVLQKKTQDKWSLTTYFEVFTTQENDTYASTIFDSDLILIDK